VRADDKSGLSSIPRQMSLGRKKPILHAVCPLDFNALGPWNFSLHFRETHNADSFQDSFALLVHPEH
jgi:hypothetical protein